MRVFTKYPGLVDAIRRAGHEPVLVDSECEERVSGGPGSDQHGDPMPRPADASPYFADDPMGGCGKRHFGCHCNICLKAYGRKQ